MTRFTINCRIRSTAVALLLPLAALSLHANGDDLVRNSPFLPHDYQPRRPSAPTPPRQTQQQPQPLDRLEFRSITNFGGRLSFSLFDPTENRSFWIGLNERDGGFSVIEFKEKEDAVVVRHEGRTRTISLHEAKVTAMAAEPTPPPSSRRPDRREQANRPEAAEERMQELAAEIKRRREIRRALVEGNEPPPPSGEEAADSQGQPPTR